MALSNALPNSIVQPGVCTSSTRPSNPYEGQFIYETDTNALYVYSGTGWVLPGSTVTPTSADHFARKGYVDSSVSTASSAASAAQTTANNAATSATSANNNANARVARSGDTMNGPLNMNSQPLYIKNSDPYHGYVYNGSIDGPEIFGWANAMITLHQEEPNVNFYFKSDGIGRAPGGWQTSSSVRYKQDIDDIDSEEVSNLIGQLRPVRYRRKDGISTVKHYGFIAEEVKEIVPEIVGYNDDGEVEALDYSKISVLAIAEIQNLKNKINSLEETISKLVKIIEVSEVKD